MPHPLYPVRRLVRGLNLASKPEEVEDDELTDVLNFSRIGALIGNIKKRPGKTMAGSATGSGARVRTLASFILDSGTRRLMAASDDQIYWLNGNTWTSLYNAGTADQRWSVAYANGRSWWCNGDATPQYWDGAAAATVAWANPPTFGGVGATSILQNLEVMFATGVSTNPMNIYRSTVGDPETFLSTRFDRVPDRQPTRGMVKVGRSLIIPTTRNGIVLTGNTRTNVEMGIIPGSEGWGNDAQYSLVAGSRGKAYWWTKKGIIATNGMSASQTPGLYKINDLFRGSTHDSRVSLSRINQVQGAAWQDYIFWTYPKTGDTTTNTRMIVYDEEMDACWLWDISADGIGAHDEVLYLGDPSTGGKVWSNTGNSDDGTDIKCGLSSSYLYAIDSEIEKSFWRLYLAARLSGATQIMQVLTTVDTDSETQAQNVSLGANVKDIDQWDPDVDPFYDLSEIENRFFIQRPARGRGLKVRVYEKSQAELEIYGFAFEYEARAKKVKVQAA